jgi:serine/alanine adding enzyme
MYKFSSNISVDDYNKFISNYSMAPITQDYRWANVKNNWDNTICGLYKDNKLIAASLLLIKRFPLGLKMIYSPKGFLIDYTNIEVLKEFTKGIKEYAKSIKAFVVKIDPLIAIKEVYMDYVEGKDKEDNAPKNYSEDNKIKIDNLRTSGYIHQGYKKEVGAYIQPRFNMVISLINKDNKQLSVEQLLNNFRRNARRYHGKFQEDRGVEFICSHDKKYIDDFIRIINSTEKRQGISLRDKSYFERIMNSFKEDAYMFLAEVNIDKYLKFLDNEIENEKDIEKNKKLIEQKEDAINIKNKYDNKVCIAATLAIIPPNKDGIKKIEYLYAGTDADLFPYFNSNASVHIYSFIEFLNKGYDYADLEGVDGSLEDHLSHTKTKYNPILFEFVGEFDLCINKFYYFIFTKFNKQLKKIYKRIVRLIKK